MASENTEKIPDIVAEIRYQARVFHDAGKTYAEYTLTDYADRIEAAASRACRAIDVQAYSTCIEGCEAGAIRKTIEEHFGEAGYDE